MLEKIKKFIKYASEYGLELPAARDHANQAPSTTLFAFYLGLFLSCVSIIAYHILPDKLIGPTSMTLLFLAMSFVFYRLRNLDKVSLDLDDKEITLEDIQDNNEKEKKE